VTEAEWLECAKPHEMLQFLRNKASNRKLRLFACACCRRIWNLLSDERSRKAVEVAEQYADGHIRKEELSAAQARAEQAIGAWWRRNSQSLSPEQRRLGAAAKAAKAVARSTDRAATLAAEMQLATSLVFMVERIGQAYASQPVSLQCNFLRCIFGNPMRPVTIDRTWLTWNAGAIPKLAQAIYDERAFDRLPLLAPTLEQAGCADRDILEHCRGPGPHVRGCWVVDLLLKKE
jgi:hypothetical protein